MCKPISAIILKDSVYISEVTMSHTDMLWELSIEDTRENAETLFVRAKLYPKDNYMFSDVDTWEFNVDQDIIPEWFVSECEKERMTAAAKEYAKKHILQGGHHELHNGIYWANNSTVTAYNNSTVTAYNNSTVRAYNNSTVAAYNNSTVTAYNNSTVRAYNNSTVRAWGNSTVTAYNNSTVRAYYNSTVAACDNSTVAAYNNSTVIIPLYSSNDDKNITLKNNATLKNCKTKTITQAGNWTYKEVE